MVELLLDMGVPVDISINGGMTPLHAAIFYNNLDIVNLLRSRGASMTKTHLGLTCADYLNPSKNFFTLSYYQRIRYGTTPFNTYIHSRFYYIMEETELPIRFNKKFYALYEHNVQKVINFQLQCL